MPISPLLSSASSEPCVYLGERHGDRLVKLCCGKEQSIPLFRCGHPSHGTVTMLDCASCVDFQAPPAKPRTVLLRFLHGLGDHIQFGVVLQNLRARHPEWRLEMACWSPWAAGFVQAGLCDAVHQNGKEFYEGGYHMEVSVAWNDPATSYATFPSTKAERCLLEVFGITPRPELCQYKIGILERDRRHIRQWMGSSPYALLHYRGRDPHEGRSLTDDQVAPLARMLTARGLRCLILDFDGKSQLGAIPNVTLIRRNSTAWPRPPDAQALAALAEQAKLCVGIDSGPGKVMGATQTPTLIVWKDMHPLHYAAPSDNVVHLVPSQHEDRLRPSREAGASYFYANYPHYVIQQNVAVNLTRLASQALDNWPSLIGPARSLVGGAWRLADLPIVREQSADEYRLSELKSRLPALDQIVDLGAHVGLFSRRAARLWPSADLLCVEPAAENIAYLRRNVEPLEGASIEHAAAVPRDDDWCLLNSCGGNAGSSDSVVIQCGRAIDWQARWPGRWRIDTTFKRFLPVAELLAGRGRVLLKIDIEGGEWSLLPAIGAHRQSLVGIVLEYHGGRRGEGAWERLEAIVHEHFPGWMLRLLSNKREIGYDDGSCWILPPQTSQPQLATPCP